MNIEWVEGTGLARVLFRVISGLFYCVVFVTKRGLQSR